MHKCSNSRQAKKKKKRQSACTGTFRWLLLLLFREDGQAGKRVREKKNHNSKFILTESRNKSVGLCQWCSA